MKSILKIIMRFYYFIAELIHSENKIYTINLKKQNYKWYFHCVVVIIIVLLEVIYRYLPKYFELNDIKLISRFIFALYVLKILFELFKYILSFFYTELKVIKLVDYRMKKFMESNKLIERIKSKEGYEKIVYAPIIKYQLKHDKLIIKFRIDGTPKSKSYFNYQKQLQGLLRLTCTKVDSGVSYCVYEFRRGKIEQIMINDVIDKTPAIPSKDSIDINSELKWNFRKAPHGLISGVTGGGKTYLLAYIIRMFLCYKADVRIIDPKRSDMSFLEKYLGKKVAYNNDDIVKILETTVTEMNHRFDEFKTLPNYTFGKDYYDYNYNPVVLVFDEVMAFMGGSAEATDKKSVTNCLLDLIAKDRQSGFFVILTTQRADSRFIDGSLRDQLSFRTALGKMSSDGYKMAFGNGYNLKLSDTSKGAGFIFIDGVTEHPVEFNSPYLNPDYDFIKDIEELTKSLKDKNKLKNAPKISSNKFTKNKTSIEEIEYT